MVDIKVSEKTLAILAIFLIVLQISKFYNYCIITENDSDRLVTCVCFSN